MLRPYYVWSPMLTTLWAWSSSLEDPVKQDYVTFWNSVVSCITQNIKARVLLMNFKYPTWSCDLPSAHPAVACMNSSLPPATLDLLTLPQTAQARFCLRVWCVLPPLPGVFDSWHLGLLRKTTCFCSLLKSHLSEVFSGQCINLLLQIFLS